LARSPTTALSATNSGRSRWPARRKKLGIKFPPERVYIIGDTPHDIACGNAIGAKTIAVATGAFSVEELAALNPTHTFKDLSDTQALLDVIL